MIVTTPGQLAELIEAYSAFEAFAFDVETIGEHRVQPRRNEVFWLSLAGPGRADVIPMGHPLGQLLEEGYKTKLPEADCPAPDRCHRCSKGQRRNKDGSVSRATVLHRISSKFGRAPQQLDQATVFAALEPLFFSDKIKIGQNIKFDAQSVAKYYDWRLMPGPLVDVMVMARVIDENFTSYKLGEQVDRSFDFKYDKKIGEEVEIYSFEDVAKYSYLDSKYTWLLYREYQRILERPGHEKLHDLFWFVEMPITRIVAKMELAGATIDPEGFQVLHDELDFRMRQLDKVIEEANGGQPLKKSGPQLIEFVYDKRGNKPTLFTETGLPQTGIKALEMLAYRNPQRVNPDTGEKELDVPRNIKDPIIAAVIERGKISKLFGTYLHNNIAAVEEEGKLYGQFQQVGTDTGRFSSKEPNLQNIPVRSPLGKRIREMFVAGRGRKLVVADYSQVELRILAHYTEDPMLLKAYREGLDLHEITARVAYSLPADKDVPSKSRSLAKNVNFSVAYGGTAWTIATRYEVPEKDAETVVQGFHKAYPKVEPWKRRELSKAKNRYRKKDTGQPYVAPYFETILGRRRRLPRLMWPDDKLRRRAERQGINAIIQGTAADVAKLAMIELDNMIEAEGLDWQLVMVVHDEFVVSVPEGEADDAARRIEKCMTSVNMLSVPLEVGVLVVDRWSDAK